MEITVRTATTDDLPLLQPFRTALHALHVKARPDIFIACPGNAWHRRIAEQISDPTVSVLVAQADGVVCGYCTAFVIDKPETPYSCARRYFRIEEIYTDPAYRRRGVGAALLLSCKKEARQKACPRIELDMWTFNDGALAFYEAQGFRPFRQDLELFTDE